MMADTKIAGSKERVIYFDDEAGPEEIEDAFYEVIMARNSIVLQEDVFEAFQAAMRRV